MLLLGDQLVEGSIYRLLAEYGAALFGEEYFADLFKRSTLGRPTVPARVVATVMLLLAYEGRWWTRWCVMPTLRWALWTATS